MKKIRLCLIALVLIVFIYGGTKTYSYYIDEHNRIVDYEIASWVVKVNSTDITTEDSHTFSINDLLVTNSNVNAKLAPGTDGTFTILVDLTDVKTAADVHIAIDQDAIHANNWTIARATADHGSLAAVDYPSPGYRSTLAYSVINTYKRFLYTFKIAWPNNEANNESDTAIGNIKDNFANIPVTVTVTQRGE